MRYTQSFSLGRAIALLSDPMTDDLTANLPDDVIAATRASEHGFSSPFGRGRALVMPLHYLVRDLGVGTAGAGGNLVGQPKSTALDALRGQSVVLAAGVNVNTIPIGNPPALPFVASDPAASWAASEGAPVGESEPTFGLAAFVPHTLGVRYTVTRRLAANLTPDNERAVTRSALRALARGLDSAVLQGAGGGGQPQGLATLSGVAVTSGSSLSYAAVVGMVADCLAGGALEDDIKIVGAVNTFETLSARERAPGSGHIWQDGRVAGRPAFASLDAPPGSLFVGDFSQVHLAVHAGITVIVDAYTFATSGAIRVVMLADVDIQHPRPSAFARAVGVT